MVKSAVQVSCFRQSGSLPSQLGTLHTDPGEHGPCHLEDDGASDACESIGKARERTAERNGPCELCIDHGITKPSETAREIDVMTVKSCDRSRML